MKFFLFRRAPSNPVENQSQPPAQSEPILPEGSEASFSSQLLRRFSSETYGNSTQSEASSIGKWFAKYSIRKLGNPWNYARDVNLFSTLALQEATFSWASLSLTEIVGFLKIVLYYILCYLVLTIMNVLPPALIENSRTFNCSFGVFCPEVYKMSGIGTLKTIPVLLTWYLAQFALALVPVGSLFRFENRESKQYVCVYQNSVFGMFISMGVASFLPPQKLDPYHVHQMLLISCLLSLVAAFVVSLWIHFWTKTDDQLYWSEDATEIYQFVNFFVGQIQHPLLYGMDLKRFLSLRPGLIGLVVFDWILVLDHLKNKPEINSSFFTLCIMHFVYVLFTLTLEIEFLGSARYTRDGFGYMHSWYSLVFYPTSLAIQSFYLFENERVELGGPFRFFSLSIFFIGCYMLFISMKCKNIFRRKIEHPKVVHLARCHQNNNKGCGFLSSGSWGLIRHPNLLAEALISLSFCLVCGFDNWNIYVPLCIQLIILYGRALRKEFGYRVEYSESYANYSKQVLSLPGL